MFFTAIGVVDRIKIDDFHDTHLHADNGSLYIL
jgi:hypothetical protein